MRELILETGAAALRSSWLAGAAVAAASWNLSFTSPAPGNDGSWVIGLYMAAEQGLRFGEELVFTYGPLGFLSPLSPSHGGLAVAVEGDLAQLAFLYGAALQLLLAVSLVWVLRRRLGAPLAVAAAFVLIAAFPAIHRPFALVAIWCLAALAEKPDPLARRVVIVGGGALAAVESLVRLGTGPALLAMCALAILAGEGRRRDLGALAAIYVALVAALWFGVGQDAGNAGDYIANGARVVSGYSEGMANVPEGARWDLAALAGALATASLVAGAALSTRGRGRRLAAGATVAIAAFAAFKQGVVREDEAHLAILFATAVAVAVAIPWRRALLPAGAAVIAALVALAIATTTPPLAARAFDPIGNVDSLGSQLRALVSSERREELAAAGRELIDTYSGLDPATLSLLRGHSVHVDPSGAATVWAYGLDWRPLPVFQENLAYTTALDQLNVDALESADGPELVLRGSPAAIDPFDPRVIDGRFPAWNPPAVNVALLCGFRALRTTARWQVLGRAAERCGEPRALGSIEAAGGEPVAVPAGGENEAVIARVHGTGVSGLERLRSFLFRARLRFLEVNGERSFRLVPGTAEEGLVLSVPPALDHPRPFSLSPGAETIEITGAGGELRIDFYALPLARRGS